jgi:hypothetical protein
VNRSTYPHAYDSSPGLNAVAYPVAYDDPQGGIVYRVWSPVHQPHLLQSAHATRDEAQRHCQEINRLQPFIYHLGEATA